MDYQNTSSLTSQTIDGFSANIQETLEKQGVEKQNIMRIRLSMEEALLRLRDHYGEDKMVGMFIRRRLNQVEIMVEVKGEAYNPLAIDQPEQVELGGSLLTAAGLRPQYTYVGGQNTLRVSLSLPGMNPIRVLLLSLIGGFLIGFLGLTLLQTSQLDVACRLFMDPLYDMWSRILNCISGPVFFLMFISTVMDTARIAERGGDNRRNVLRFFLFSFLMCGVAVAASYIVFPFTLVRQNLDDQVAKSAMEQLVNLVPEDFVSPLMAADSPQLMFLGFCIGSVLNALGEQVQLLKVFMRQISIVAVRLTEWVSSLSPYALFLLLGLEIWKQRISLLLEIWKCILLAFVVSLLCMLINIAWVSYREKTGFRLLAGKLYNTFMMTLRYGSVNAVVAQAEKNCVFDLGIKREYTEIGLPVGLLLYMPINSVGTLIMLIFMGKETGAQMTMIWMLTAVTMSVILFVAATPVPGSNLLAFVVMFAQLGIPREALIPAMIFDVIFGVFASAANQLLLQLEMILQADRLGMLDQRILRRPT